MAIIFGYDASGNGNNWTANNLSNAPGVGNDSMVDTPTSYGTDTGVGGEVRGNYCTWNPIAPSTVVNGTVTRSDGNLVSTDGGTTYGLASIGTIAVSSGKWYWEVTLTTASDIYANIGVVNLNSPLGANLHTGICYRQSNGYKDSGSNVFGGGGAGTAYGATYAAGDVIGVALDLDGGTITFYKNGVSQGTAYSSISGNYTPGVGDGANGSSYTFTLNAGQRAFAYTAPSGFKALCTQNLPTPTIGATSTTQANDYMNVVLYTGNGTTTGNTQAITGVGFQPDFVWLKSRSNGTYYHLLNDAVRGANKVIYSNNDLAETTVTNVFNSFDSDGFTVAYNSSYSNVRSNENTVTYVGWNWKANGAGSTNSNGTAKSSSVTVDSSTDTVTWNSHGMSDGQKIGFFASVMPGGLSAGTLYFVRDAATNTFKVAATSGGAAIDITSNGTTVTCHTTLTSTVSANTTSEFSIITYTGSGSNATIEHGLDIAPTLVIVKERPNTDSWLVWQSSISAANYLVLNSTASSTAGSTIWNSTAPTSKVFSVGTNTAINQSSQTYVAYCFAPVDGYSAFGSYESNNSTDGPFIYLGFRARWIMFKRSSTGTNGWAIYDTARNTFNATDNNLHANSSGAENSVVGVQPIDVTANGIKIRTSWSDVNGTGTYIYAAFAEHPFKYSLAR